MRDILKSLAGCKDIESLQSAIHEHLTEFGEIAHMEILGMTQPGKRQAVCFLRLESAPQEERLRANLGVTRFGNELLFVVDLFTEQQAIAAARSGDSDRDRTNREAAVRHPAYDREKNAGERRFWSSPARWSETLLGGARREWVRDIEWLHRMVR